MVAIAEDVGIDTQALQRLIEEHPDELRLLIENTQSAMCDKYGRTIRLLDKVTTPAGEGGMVIRFDKKSRRVLIKLDTGKTRMLMAHRVEVKRGRPRKLKTA